MGVMSYDYHLLPAIHTLPVRTYSASSNAGFPHLKNPCISDDRQKRFWFRYLLLLDANPHLLQLSHLLVASPPLLSSASLLPSSVFVQHLQYNYCICTHNIQIYLFLSSSVLSPHPTSPSPPPLPSWSSAGGSPSMSLVLLKVLGFSQVPKTLSVVPDSL